MVPANLGYLDLEGLHAHHFLPVKATKHHPLTVEEKRANRNLARLRLRIEQVVGKLKVSVTLRALPWSSQTLQSTL